MDTAFPMKNKNYDDYYYGDLYINRHIADIINRNCARGGNWQF
jgi:hypothetical protein